MWIRALLLLAAAPFAKERDSLFVSQQQEFAYIAECGKKSSGPLSETLLVLTDGLVSPDFGPSFFDKLRLLEEKKYTGELLETGENGEIRFTAHLLNGVPDGHVHGYYSDGTEAFKAYFEKGKKIGIHIAFHPKREGAQRSLEGMARLLVYSREGELYGAQYGFDYRGDLIVKANYRKGVLHGVKTLIAEEYVREELYKNGKGKKENEQLK